jgi:putative addiction module killer protein
MRVEQTKSFVRWMTSLRDVAGRARILQRIDRLAHGNPGNSRGLRHGVKELKVDFGPGYRIYYTLRGNSLVVLLAGGDKSTQAADIRQAIALAIVLEEPDK